MIVAFKHEDMNSGKVMGEFYNDLLSFTVCNFNINVSSDGHVSIGDWICSVSYSMEVYDEAEVRTAFIKSEQFRKYAKSRFWTVYSIKDKLI